MDRIGLPFLREALVWFECQVVSEHHAGDHVLVLGKVIDGKRSGAHVLSRNRRNRCASTLYAQRGG
jgi:flavin reductase (DIM6/NTAB) family NADH-FMN oxidoreductase RutF